MKNMSVHLVLMTTIFFTALVPSSSLHAGDFLKKIFGKRCRAICVQKNNTDCNPCAPQCDSSDVCCYAPRARVNVCPLALQLEVLDGNSCAFAVYSASDCMGNYFGINMPCNVGLANCVGRSCRDANNNPASRIARPTFAPSTGSHFDEGLALGIVVPNAATIQLRPAAGVVVANERTCNIIIDGVLKTIRLMDVTLANGKKVGVAFEIAGGTPVNSQVVQVANEGYLKSKLLLDQATQMYYFCTLSR